MHASIRLAISALLLACLSACSKDDSTGPLPKRPVIRVSSALLPDPSCSDTSDDGTFEVWNAAEDSLIYQLIPTLLPPSVYRPGYMQNIRIVNPQIAASDPVFLWSAEALSPDSWLMEFALVDRESGRVVATSSESMPKSGKDAVTVRKSFSSTLHADTALTPGCRRLYYSGVIPRFKQPSMALQPADTLEVLFRGHFDIEVR